MGGRRGGGWIVLAVEKRDPDKKEVARKQRTVGSLRVLMMFNTVEEEIKKIDRVLERPPPYTPIFFVFNFYTFFQCILTIFNFFALFALRDFQEFQKID